MDIQEQIETLNKLGLTINQSKIFIALVQSNLSTVKRIAKSANVPPEVIYRSIPKLQEMGLITKTISFPIEFKAISVDSATRILLKRRNREMNELKTKTNEFVAQMKNRHEIENKKEPQVILICGREHLKTFSKQHLLSTQTSLDTMIIKTKFSIWWTNSQPILKKLLDRNVKIRVIIASSTKNEQIPDKNLEQIKKYQNFTIKLIPDKVEAGIGIIDNKDILINTLPNSVFPKASFYWSNDPGVIALCATYFEKFWNKN